MKNEKGEPIVRADTDGKYYRREDTRWAFEPTDEDPGFLEPIPGAKEQEPLSFTF